MSARPASFVVRFSSIVLAVAVLALVGLPACGRSNLDDYLLGDGGGLTDSSTDADAGDAPETAPACNATTCPAGCCDGAGTCQTGAAVTQCGSLGEACNDCSAEGFQLCDPTRHACGNPVASCDFQDCSGCCEGNVCFAGSDPNECGFSGNTCQHCANESLACSNQQCVTPPCGPGTCSGCCFGTECLSGQGATACGIKGQVCSNCTANGTSCVAQGSVGGVCEGVATCSPANCTGCCAGNVCVSGTSPTQCGELGQACANCQSTGGTCFSTGEGGFCQGQSLCGPQNCQGCCEGDLCVNGTQPGQCGIGGQVCGDCAAQGGLCVASGNGIGGFCELNTGCGPGTCAGCCDQNGTCVGGTSDLACGIDGSFCTDCAATNGTCGAGLCNQPPPVCNAKTCPSGCCDAHANCLPGNLDSFCGAGGAACQDCAASSESCSKQICIAVSPTCNASTCLGCCDQAGACQAGFIDAQCGQSGASCEDCSQIIPSSVCDVSVAPRTCESQQVQCPAPYSSCPATIETPSPAQQNVCSQSDLQNAGSACEGGAHSSACNSFFSFEQSQNPACAKCLGAFDYDFSELTGLTTCVAPFADPACNHITGCLVDCTDQACAGCTDSGSLTACQNEVPNTTCATYYNGAQCINSAFFGPGSFCNPQTGLFGDWLAQVGQFYCAQ
ncbi:MAG: hypothetical protein ACRELB_18440 [Polyangiaceae bacterium]